MNILHITHRFPYPPNKGDKIRAFNIMQHVAISNTLHLVTLIDNREDASLVSQLRRYVSNLLYARIDWPGRRLISLLSLPIGRSATVDYFYSWKLQKKVDSLLETTNFDVVLCSSSPMAEYILRSRHFDKSLRKAIKIMDLIDVDSVKWAQYSDAHSGVRSWLYAQEGRALRNYERRIYDTFDYLLLVSEKELELFPNRDSGSKLKAISNGVDLEYFSPQKKCRSAGSRPRLVFTGMMDYWPNIQGMRWFFDHAFMPILEAVPDVEVYVVGGRPDPEVVKWGNRHNVVVTGFVDDIRSYIASADVCIVPLQIARGIQNKVLEAMAMGQPVVSTPAALDGIGAVSGEHAIAAGTDVEFSNAIVELLRDRNLAAEIGNNARNFVRSNFDWSTCLAPLDRLIAHAGSTSMADVL